MADKTDPAPAEEQPFALEPGTPGAPVTAETPETSEAAPEAAAPASDPADAPEPTRADAIAALIRNGLSNSPISQSEATWSALETLLPGIVAAILEA